MLCFGSVLRDKFSGSFLTFCLCCCFPQCVLFSFLFLVFVGFCFDSNDVFPAGEQQTTARLHRGRGGCSLVTVGGNVDLVDQPSAPPGFQIERGETGQSRLRYALVEYWRSLAFVLRNAIPCLVNVSYQLVMLRMLELTW